MPLILRKAGQPFYVGIDASSKLMPTVVFLPGIEKPIVLLYKLADRAGPAACGAAIKSVNHLVQEHILPHHDLRYRLNLVVYIERHVLFPGGRGNAVAMQSLTSGAIQGAFNNHGASIGLVPPSTWKKAVLGHGSLDKRGIAMAVRARWPRDAEMCGKSQDLLDAYCIARYARTARTRRP